MKIEIKKSFIVFFTFFAVFYDYRQLFLFELAVLLHELSHMLVAKIYKLDISALTISFFGMNCTIKNIGSISLSKKLFLTAIGVIVNILIFIFCSVFFKNNELINYFKYSNLLLFMVNILPIYPLDGSMLYTYLIGHFKGYLNACKDILKLSKIVSFIVIVIGFIITTLYPSNFFVFLFGVYLFKKSKENTYSQMNFDFYRALNQKHENFKSLNIKYLLVNENMSLNDIILKISLDNYLICYYEIDSVLTEITEKEIFEKLEI